MKIKYRVKFVKLEIMVLMQNHIYHSVSMDHSKGFQAIPPALISMQVRRPENLAMQSIFPYPMNEKY